MHSAAVYKTCYPCLLVFTHVQFLAFSRDLARKCLPMFIQVQENHPDYAEKAMLKIDW